MQRLCFRLAAGFFLYAAGFISELNAQEVSTLVGSVNASGGVSVGPDGNIYVANFGILLNNSNGNTVYQVTPDGQVSVFATGFAGASGNDFDADGNLIQASIGGNRLDRVTPGGVRTIIVNTGLINPVGVAIDSKGTIFAANCGGNAISRVQGAGAVVFASGPLFNCPNGLTVDSDDNLYSVNFGDGRIIKITPGGQASLLAVTPGSSFRPGGGNGHITFGNGRLYLGSNATSQIFELTLDGQLTVLAGDGTRGHKDGPALEASFSFPNGIALSADGRFLYLNESMSTAGTILNGATFPLTPNLVRVIDLGSQFTINAGLNGAWADGSTPGQGVFIDVVTSQNLLVMGWFTFETDQGITLDPGENERRWMIAVGPVDGDTATLDLISTDGGVFDGPDPVTETTVGNGTIRFSSCSEAVLEFSLDEGLSGTIELSRVLPDSLCANLSEGAG